MFPLRPLSLSSFFCPLSSVLSRPPLFCLSLYHSDHPIPASSYPLPPSLIPSSSLLPSSLALPLSPSPVLFVAVSQRPSYPHLFLSPYALSPPLPSSPCLLIPALIPFCPLPSYNKKIRAVTFRHSPDFLLSIKLLLQHELLRVYQIDT